MILYAVVTVAAVAVELTFEREIVAAVEQQKSLQPPMPMEQTLLVLLKYAS